MSLVNFEIDGAVAIVTLDRPPVNALSAELSVELKAAFERCEDDTIRAVVVTGEPHFAAGADIKGFQSAYESGEQEELAASLVAAIWSLEGLEKPTIAAVHGFALGGGLELAMGADFRYLADDAKVGQPEILLGLIPGAGGTQRLQRIVGFQRAKELVYSGRQVTAEEARAIGLADQVHGPDVLLERAVQDAHGWATKATRGIAAAKRALQLGAGRPMEDAMKVEAEMFTDVFWSEDAKEGVAAFIEKRAAEFRNA